MATYLERAQALGLALLNRAPTLPELDKWGRALAWQTGREQEYNAATTEQRAWFIVTSTLDRAVAVISQYDEESASRTARAAASDAVKAAFKEQL